MFCILLTGEPKLFCVFVLSLNMSGFCVWCLIIRELVMGLWLIGSFEFNFMSSVVKFYLAKEETVWVAS